MTKTEKKVLFEKINKEDRMNSLVDFVTTESEHAWWIDVSPFSSRVGCFLCDEKITVGPGVDFSVVGNFINSHRECNTLED